MKIVNKLKLYHKILGICLVITMLISLFMRIALEHIRENILENQKQEMVSTTTLVGAMAESLFDFSIQNYLRGISETHLNTVQYYYAQFQKGLITEDAAKQKVELLFLNHSIGQSGYVTSVDISHGNDSITLAIHPKAKGANISTFDFVQNMARKKNGYLEFDWKNPNEKQSKVKAEYMSFFEPWQWIISAAPYKSEFYSFLDINLFRKHLKNAQVSNVSGSYVMVFNTNGEMIYHPHLSGQNIMNTKDAKTGKLFIKELILTIKNSTNTNHDGWINYAFSKRGDANGPVSDKMMYYKYLPDHEWIVATIISKDEILGPYHSLRQELTLLGVFVIFGMVLISLFFSRAMTARLSNLIQASRLFAKNQYDFKLQRRSYDEIGDLEHAFADATGKICTLLNKQNELNENLENKIRDRTRELENKNEQLERLYVTDRLTGLYNRHKLDDVLMAEIQRSKRYYHPFSIIILDIDFFKSVNDTHGHQTGDLILKKIGKLLKTQSRCTDIVGRWGGEEFLILCPETDLGNITTLAEKLRTQIAQHNFPIVGNKTVSIGITMYLKDDTVESMITRADEALYEAKNSGRNKVVSAL